jgi:hypothetical protein
MPNAVYLVVYPRDAQRLPSFMQGLNQSYALYFNKRYNGLGKVWGARYKSAVIRCQRDLLEAVKLVEFIPIRKGDVGSPFEYPYSSCRNRILGLGGVINCLPQNEIRLSEILIHKDVKGGEKDESKNPYINDHVFNYECGAGEGIDHIQ